VHSGRGFPFRVADEGADDERNLPVSALFPDIIQCMPIQVLEIKKSASFLL
jgi:hypothetical protein